MYQDQISKGLAVFHCDSCGEGFWLKPDTAQARTCQGKKLWCRVCFTLNRDDCPDYPFARRLMPDEVKELEWIQYHVEPQEAAPEPPEPEKIELSSEMTRLRIALANTLTQLGWTRKRFAKAAKVNLEVIDKLLDEKLKRSLQDRVALRIRMKLAELRPTEERDEQTQAMVDTVFGNVGKKEDTEKIDVSNIVEETDLNPIETLTQEEKIYLIKTLPEDYIKKLNLI
jgi:hypothetical protein